MKKTILIRWYALVVILVSVPLCRSFCQFQELYGLGLPAEAITLPDTITISARIAQAKTVLDNQPDSAIAMLKLTLRQSQVTGYDNGVAQSLLALGRAFTLKARYDEAIYLWRAGISMLSLKNNDPKLLASFYSNLGVAYQIKGAYTESLDLLFRALALAGSAPGNEQGLAVAYNNIATLFLKMPDAAQSKQAYYLEKAALYASKANDARLQAAVLVNKGTMYASRQDWAHGKQYFDSALGFSVRHGLVETQYSVLLSIGELYLSRGKTKDALSYLEKARALDQEAVNPYYRTLTELRLGEAYARTGRYREALQFVSRAEQSSIALGVHSYRSQVYDSYSRLYRQTGDYEKALLYYQRYTAMNDSLLQRESLNYIAEMDAKYRTLQNEQEVERSRLVILDQQSRLSRNHIFILLTAACLLLMATLLFFSIKSAAQRRKILLKEKSIDILKSRIEGEEKERLRISKELHDGIGGMLAAIKYNFSSLSRQLAPDGREKLRDIGNMLEVASSEVRTAAYNLVPDVVLNFGLKEALQTYCNSVSGVGLDIWLQFHGNTGTIGASTELVLYRIVQELVQNVIKHAGASRIDIQLMEYDGHMHLTFEDNGRGFDPCAVQPGLGLENIRRRVEFLQGSLSIAPVAGKGTSIHLSFPVQKS